MDKPMSNFHFRVIAFNLKIRDFFLPPVNTLKEAGIKPRFHVLDYGCGPGSYIIAAAEMVGKSGKIYALDINPIAIQSIKSIISKRQLTNVETILSDCRTGLPDDGMDVVLLYDTLHLLSEPDRVLEELHRVLKSDGILSLSDHHMKENEIMSKVTKSGLFRLVRKDKRTYSFLKDD